MAHFVFVHGALHASWCWEPVEGPLRTNGHVVDLIDLPGRPGTGPVADASLDSYRDTVESAVRGAGEPVVLVAHSMGGLSTCLALERVHQLVSRVVFVNAVLLRDGETVLAMLQAMPAGACRVMDEGALDVDDSVIRISSSEVGIDAFYNRCRPDVAAAAVARLCPEPLVALTTPVTPNLGAFKAIPKVYIGSQDDNVLPFEYQQRVAAAFGAEFVELTGDHSPFHSATEDLLACLSKVAAQPT